MPRGPSDQPNNAHAAPDRSWGKRATGISTGMITDHFVKWAQSQADAAKHVEIHSQTNTPSVYTEDDLLVQAGAGAVPLTQALAALQFGKVDGRQLSDLGSASEEERLWTEPVKELLDDRARYGGRWDSVLEMWEFFLVLFTRNRIVLYGRWSYGGSHTEVQKSI